MRGNVRVCFKYIKGLVFASCWPYHCTVSNTGQLKEFHNVYEMIDACGLFSSLNIRNRNLANQCVKTTVLSGHSNFLKGFNFIGQITFKRFYSIFVGHDFYSHDFI